MKIKWIIIPALALTFALVAVNSNSFADKQTTQVNMHKSFTEVTKPEILDMLNKSWANGVNKIINLKGLQIKDWRLINSGDVDIEIIKNLSQAEASSFNAAFFSDARKNSLQVGDKFPAVLVNKTTTELILFWERENGNIVLIPIKKDVLNTNSLSSIVEWKNGEATEIQ